MNEGVNDFSLSSFCKTELPCGQKMNLAKLKLKPQEESYGYSATIYDLLEMGV